MYQRLLWTGTLAMAVLVGAHYFSQPSSAQSPAASAEEGKPADRRGPLPFYFGKLGLSETQKESLYKTQEEYEKKLAPLRDQLKSLVRERDQKLEASLTEGQKLRLKELREEAKKKGDTPEPGSVESN